MAGGCGLGALLAAKQQKVWGIGVDADQSFLGPHVLTSALKGVDSAVFLTSKSVQDGMFKGGSNAVFGLDQEGVGLGKFSPNANKADIAETEKIEKQIADGTITGHSDDGRASGHLDRENPWLSSPTRNARSCRTTRSSAP